MTLASSGCVKVHLAFGLLICAKAIDGLRHAGPGCVLRQESLLGPPLRVPGVGRPTSSRSCAGDGTGLCLFHQAARAPACFLWPSKTSNLGGTLMLNLGAVCRC